MIVLHGFAFRRLYLTLKTARALAVITGIYLDAIQHTHDIIIKYTASNGDVIWNKSFNSGYDDLGMEIGIDKQDNCFVVGKTADGSKGLGIIRKYDTDGNLQWSKTYSYNTDTSSRFNGIAVLSK